MMDLRRLRLLFELSQQGTVARTAQALSYTPSAVSQQLMVLEREAGVPLLERDGRRVILTPAAHRLVARTAHIIDELEAASAELHAGKTTIDGEVRVGTFPSAGLALVVPTATELTAHHPEVSVTVRETDPDDGARLLHSGALDILVAYQYDALSAVPSSGFDRVPLLEDQLLFAVLRSDPLAARSPVDIAELADAQWVAGAPGTAFGALVQTTCRAAGFEPRIVHRAREFAVQQALVAADLGVALLPALACTTRLPEVRYMPIRPPGPTRHVHLLLRHGSRQRPAVRATIDELAIQATRQQAP